VSISPVLISNVGFISDVVDVVVVGVSEVLGVLGVSEVVGVLGVSEVLGVVLFIEKGGLNLTFTTPSFFTVTKMVGGRGRVGSIFTGIFSLIKISSSLIFFLYQRQSFSLSQLLHISSQLL
tara:strand:+ start:934 stop:1296 length:363 start_codon:yes stop_codon:yes gene_type:complete